MAQSNVRRVELVLAWKVKCEGRHICISGEGRRQEVEGSGRGDSPLQRMRRKGLDVGPAVWLRWALGGLARCVAA